MTEEPSDFLCPGLCERANGKKKKKCNLRLWNLGREKPDEKDRGTRRKG